MSTGVFLTGILLLRICDPNLESPALANYSLSYTVTSVIYFALLNLFIMMPMTSGVATTTFVALALGIGMLIVTIVSSRLFFGKDFKGN